MQASTKAPSAWRGVSPARSPAMEVATSAQNPFARLVRRAGREVVDHPMETLAVCAMTLALARLALRQERAIELPATQSNRRRRRIAPITLMAAMCLLMFSGQ